MFEKTKINEKRPGFANFFKKRSIEQEEDQFFNVFLIQIPFANQGKILLISRQGLKLGNYSVYLLMVAIQIWSL